MFGCDLVVLPLILILLCLVSFSLLAVCYIGYCLFDVFVTYCCL